MKENLTKLFIKLKDFILKRKILSIFILLIVVFAIYKIFFSNTNTPVTTYSIDTVSRQTVISYLSETGQVSVDGSIDLKSNVSGQITSIKVSSGDNVQAGDLIATIKSDSAYNTLQQAKLSYQNAQLSYAKATSPSDSSSILSAENNLTNSSSSLIKGYQDSFNSVSDTYSDMSSVISSLHDILYLSDLNSGQENIYFYSDNERFLENSHGLVNDSLTYFNKTQDKYDSAKNSYAIAFAKFQSLSRYSNNDDIYNSLSDTIISAKDLSDALKASILLVQHYNDLYNEYNLTQNSKVATYISNLKTYQNTINTDITNLSSNKNYIDDLKLTISEQQLSLEKLQSGVTGLDLDAASLSLKQARLSYNSALDNYSNYFINAPINGTISSVSAIVGQDAAGTTVATLITKGKFVDLSVSENDITKIKLGQKSTITFDAIENLSLVGTISQIDAAGTVSSGVVSYKVRVAFDDTDNKVKAGMSATVNIMTDSVNDVIAVPVSAVKSNTTGNYVEVFDSTSTLIASGDMFTSISAPTKKTIVTGVTGDDYVEIVSGLKEGDTVVTKTTNGGSTIKKTTSTISSKSSAGISGSFMMGR